MPEFTITGDENPFLHVSLRQGESISCESDAMVMMEDSLDLAGQIQGGIGQALMRRLANGESFFQQNIKAVRGDGDCLLSPQLPGAMEVLEVGRTQYNLADGAYVAASSDVEITAQMQSLGTALFAGSGGFFIGRTRGTGKVVVSGFGSLFTLQVTPDKEIVIDNGHVVAWDTQLNYRISASTNRSQGLLNNLMHSVTSGEGVVLRFSGRGRVIVCSRNRTNFIAWLIDQLPASRK